MNKYRNGSNFDDFLYEEELYLRKCRNRARQQVRALKKSGTMIDSLNEDFYGNIEAR